MKKLLFFAALTLCGAALAYADTPGDDWAGHGRYAEANATLTAPPRVVFMGNSITDGWDDAHPEFFTSNNFACRGISGQVSSQMLCRFKADVIDLRPQAVVILSGANDICLNNGFISNAHILDNIASMVTLARAAGITPVVCTLLPTNHAFWRPSLTGLGERIEEFNIELRQMAREMDIPLVDYHPAMLGPDHGIDPRLSDDRLHPNAAGYAVMEPLVLAALRPLLSR